MIPRRNAVRNFQKALAQPLYGFKIFCRRLCSYLTYIAGKGKSAYPESVTLFLTFRCNLRCRMCGQWGDRGITRKKGSSGSEEELTIEEYRKLLSDLYPFRPNITLFGGEPLLYKECLELVRMIKEKKLHVCLITNGTLLRSYAYKLVQYGLDELNISLDGPEKIHDEIRGAAGMFRKIKEGLDEISQEKKRQGKRRPLINLEFTITSYNLDYMRPMLKVAEELGADSLNFHHLIFIEEDMYKRHERDFFTLFRASSEDWKGFILEGVKDIDIAKLAANIREILSRKYKFSVSVYPNLKDEELKTYYREAAEVPSGYPARCLSPWMVAYIFPDGELRPCLNFNFSPGNIKRESFKAVWNNQRYLSFRGILKQKGIFPVCTRCTELYRY